MIRDTPQRESKLFVKHVSNKNCETTRFITSYFLIQIFPFLIDSMNSECHKFSILKLIYNSSFV